MGRKVSDQGMAGIQKLDQLYREGVNFMMVDLNRDRAAMEKIKEAHRRVIVANHPDAGGSHYLASKINEGKEVLTRRTGERVSIPRSCYECGMLDGLNENSVG
ncbi:unnamed protein product [Ilex paraguariensis]|uniref:J domain-containing protein n=1 Tax=Ilex paraguariensis TaxID=185542 RepID=A0ABC8S6S8_9AQUA